METKFTEQESLAIISEMIKQARNNFQKGSGNDMIFSGLLVSAAAILNIILAFTFARLGIETHYSFWIWCLMLPGTYIRYLIKKKAIRESMVKTHIDSIISSIWKGFRFSILVFLIVMFSIGFGKEFYDLFVLINPVILLLVGFAEFIMAKVCRFNPYLYGAFIMWLGALLCTVSLWFENPVITQFFILTLCMIFGFVIPGYQLNKKAGENV